MLDVVYIFLGILSSIIWFFVYIPQFLINVQNGNANAVSFLMLLYILGGDILSYLSAKGKHLSYIIIYSSFYHCVFGTILLIQWCYYKIKNFDNYNNGVYMDEYVSLNEFDNVEEEISESPNIFKHIFTSKTFYFSIFYTIMLLLLKNLSDYVENPVFYDYMAWASVLIFIIARVPQIKLNYTRKSVSGLSKSTFILICYANTIFFSSLMIKMMDTDDKKLYVKNNIQWILGCTITTIFDLFILYQFKIYNSYDFIIHSESVI